jgi:4-hydroxythreonine-4-phosphate dehydrogenase
MGEPAGIGPEIAVAAFRRFAGHVGERPIRLVGDPDVFLACDKDVPTGALIATKNRARRKPGKPDKQNSAAVCEAISLGVEMANKGLAGAVVTGPINKAVLAESEFRFSGHTDYLAHLTGAPAAIMMLVGDGLRVVPLTIHMRLADVPRTITEDQIVFTGSVVRAALVEDFGVVGPRLAISGLNPHAGEGGILGDEERRIIEPAVKRLREGGATVLGPLPADTMFHPVARAQYDAAICMYHDQALVPLKALAFWTGVNVTLGLPIVRTSPDHGTAFDIAGTGKADARSMMAAIELAARIADARGR